MPELSPIDPGSAALLVMDYQVAALTKFITTARSADAITCVPDLIATARGAGMMVIHVVVAFRPGHPELSPRNPVFSAVKANGMMVAGSEGAAIHPAAAAREGEPIVVKHRISPFVSTDLETLLRVDLPCSPCYLRQLSRCHFGHACMADVSAAAVIGTRREHPRQSAEPRKNIGAASRSAMKIIPTNS